MKNAKKYYGEKVINLKELIETDKVGPIKLEYYGTKKIIQDEFAVYGIEVIKKEYTNKQLIEETQHVKNIAESEKDIELIISILMRNKVTPIGLKDIVKDLLSKKIAD